MSPADLENSDERMLLRRLTSGDRATFDQLAQRYVGELLRYAYRFVHSRESAEDIVQDVFCRLWDTHDTLSIRGTIRDYLFGAVRLRALEVLRSSRTSASRDARYAGGDAELARADEVFGKEIEDRERAAAIRTAIHALPERRREIVLLRLRQLTTPEIAHVLGISSKTVEAQITSAYAALRMSLQSWIR